MGEKQALMRLQNGSDVRGVAMETEGGPPVNLTEEAVCRIAGAFAGWLAERTGKKTEALTVGVGHDSRLTAAQLTAAAVRGLRSRGVRVRSCGLASTPAMFMGTVFPETAFDGSIMITASHLPQNRNGMKFFTAQGGLDKGDITALLERASELAVPSGGAGGAGEPSALMDAYAAFLRGKIVDGAGVGDRPLEGLRIVVDAGNGGGGFFPRQVLEPLGADCSGSQFLEPDGRFPNHQPNPENREAMASIQAAVREAKADLGILFDTDVDRMSAVLADGDILSRNALIAAMAAILAPEYPGSTIVTDSVTSDRLTAFLEGKLGLRHHCFKRGYKNVINEAVRLNREGTVAPLAIETSGHGALKENYFLDDGAYMAVRLIIAAAGAARQGRELTSLLDGFEPAAAQAEYRIPIAGEGFAAYGKQVLDKFRERALQKGIEITPSYEGVRLRFPGTGWAMLRVSLHDPILPLNLEGGDETGLARIQTEVRSLLKGFDRLGLNIM